MILKELAYKVSLQAKGFTEEKRKVTNEANDLKNQIEKNNKQTGESFNSLTKGVKGFGAAGVGAFSQVQIGAAKFLGVALTLEGARRMFISTTQTLVNMGNTSQFLGMSTKSLDGWSKAAESVGSSGAAATSMLARMKQANVWRQAGMGAPDGSTQALIQLEAASGMSIIDQADPGQALKNTAKALRTLPEARARTYYDQIGGDPSMYNMMMKGDLDKLVDSFTARSNKTEAAVKKAMEVNKVMTELNSTMENLATTLTMAFGDDIINALQKLDTWVSSNKEGIVGFFRDAANGASELTGKMGGLENLLKVYAGYKIGGLYGAAAAAGYIGLEATGDWADKRAADAKSAGVDTADILNYNKAPKIPGSIYTDGSPDPVANSTASWDALMKFLGFGSEPEQHAQSSRRRRPAKGSLMDAIMMTESGGDPFAVSPAGAAGAFQFMKPTARQYGLVVNDQIDERLDPVKSRDASTRRMAYLLKKYGGNTENALRAYNWGEGNMDAYLKTGRGAKGQSMPQEAVNYPFRVAEHYKGLGMMSISRPSSSSMQDNSSQNTFHIGEMIVGGSPTTANQLSSDIQAQANRTRVNVSFQNGNRS